MSKIDTDELQNMADRLKANNPKIYNVLIKPKSVNSERYEGAAGALIQYLKDNECVYGSDGMVVDSWRAGWDLALYLDPRWALDRDTLHWRTPKTIIGKIINGISRRMLP